MKPGIYNLDLSIKRSSLDALRIQRVRRSSRRDPLHILRLLLVFSLLLVLSISYLWVRLATVEVGYQISEANRQRYRLLEENRRLKMEVANLKSPGRIERIGREELGLHHPRGEEIVRVK